jgi:DNA polymerase I-like protein with 3'-5' exonuclease and polymerase domains
VNCRALGLEPKQVYTIRGQTILGRDIAKTFIYAFLYGAGAEKLGSIIGKGVQAGAKLKKRFLEGLPALKALIEKVHRIVDKQGWLPGLDGRRVPVRSKHAALNTLLQSFGALVAKLAMVIAYDEFKRRGLEVHQVLWIHDEYQYDVDPSIAQEVGEIATWAMQQAGEEFGLRVPIKGEFKVGANWAETH